MKKYLFVLGLSASASSLSATVGGFADLAFFVGSGANESALVIDFNDGSSNESLAWGYRWDTPVSGARMLVDIAAADPLLDVTFSNTPEVDFFLGTISYDGTTLGYVGGVNPPTTATSWGYYLAGGTDGFDNVTGAGDSLPSSWTLASVGAGELSFGIPGRIIADGSWDYWNYGALGAGFAHIETPAGPVDAAPVPESSAFAFFLGGAALLTLARRRKS